MRLIDARNGAESVPDLRLGEAKVISVRVGNFGYGAGASVANFGFGQS